MLAKMWAVLKGPWLALYLDSKLGGGSPFKSLNVIVVFLKVFFI